ncbi:hypothetical protein ACFWPH_22485 [Nocardia sp. NPDC058499]|uniref:hypothetical protein n=1 Tax=Nocardia sp. NPDC058499 TaxID=3346530 RepID=UPI00365EE478
MSKKKLIVVLVVLMSCCCGGPALIVAAPFAELTSMAKQDFGRQCDIALGPATGTTPTTPATTSTESIPLGPASPAPIPTTNPYASLTFTADDTDIEPRDRLCASVMQVAPWQGPELRESSNASAAVCAANLALSYPEAGGPAESADYVRDVIYSASVAGSSGRCVPGRAPRAAATENCGGTRYGEPVILPETVREQAFCGYVVDPAAISPGDLVFWDYRNNAATRAGIALGSGELVTVEDEEFVRSSVPGAGHVQIKRVLREVS